MADGTADACHPGDAGGAGRGRVGQTAARSDGLAGELRRVFAAPLGDTAVLSSVLTLPVLPFVSWPSTESLAGCLYWLSAIWLAIGWRRRNVLLFAAHQFMLAAATGVATTAWLKRQSWVVNLPDDLWHPYSLQAYGIALGVLSLLWIVARIVLRDNATAKKLLDPARPTVDWVLRHALVAAQLLVAVLYLLPGVGEELVRGFGVSASFRQMQQASFGGGAWLLLGVLALMLIVALWDRWRRAELTSLLLVAATVPCLVAGRFAGDLAVASALRWGLAVCFLVLSAAIWGRKRLLRVCRLAHAGVDLDLGGWLAAHGVTLATTASAGAGPDRRCRRMSIWRRHAGRAGRQHAFRPARPERLLPCAAGAGHAGDGRARHSGVRRPATLSPPGWSPNWP